MDLFGPTQYTSIGGNKYDFVIVDDFTRYTWAFFLVDKSDVFVTLKSFVKGIHNEFETTIKRVDNGSEFKDTRLMSCVMILELDINFRPSTLHNQMALWRGRMEHLLTWQGLCLVSTM
jgi:transposase InsO family protein